MDLSLNGAINNFQKRIGTYDKDNWEIIVEKQSIPQISEHSSIAKLPTDLLDVDLIRGSTFTKTKPGYHWTQVTANGFLKLVFFPFYYRWWKSQISIWVWLLMALYFLQLFGLVIYLLYQTDDSLVDISWPEAFVPFMAMLLVGQLYIHVVSSNFTKPIAHKMKKKNKKRSQADGTNKSKRPGRNKERKKSSKRGSPRRHVDFVSDEGIESYEGRRINDTSPERVTSREASVERPLHTDEESILPKTEVASYGNGECILQSEVASSGIFHISNGPSITTDSPPLLSRPKVSLPQSLNGKKLNSPTGVSRSKHSSSGSQDEVTTTEEENSNSEASSDTTLSETEASAETTTEFMMFQNYGFLSGEGSNKLHTTQSSAKLVGNNDQITVSIWHGTSFKKLKLTFFEIGLEVVKQVENHASSSDYMKFAMMSAFLIGILPMMFRVYQAHVVHQHISFSQAISQLCTQVQTVDGLLRIYQQLYGSTVRAQVVIVIAMIGRIASSFSLFFMLCVAEGTYKKRYMYAKFFSALTSTRRARRNQVPHFRLHKVKNIKAWLSLRSFLKKRGPQRSVDTIVSAAFLAGVLLLVLCCVQFLSVSDQKDHFLSYFFSWELSAWGLVIGVFLIRFIALGSDINRKYRNSSVLLTEQINLYLQMEKYPEKKEEFHIANNVLKLASDLLKELDSSFKVSGFIMNPLLSNITRVVVLSLFSGVMSDILGFRLRLWKIKA